MAGTDDRFFTVLISEPSKLDGSPLLLEDGKMIGMMLGEDTELTTEDRFARAVKSNTIKPILKEWFEDVELKRKWKEKGVGIAAWVWAVGGGVAAGAATILGVTTGGDSGGEIQTISGLPTPPDPPQP
jgi:hypothetical protein